MNVPRKLSSFCELAPETDRRARRGCLSFFESGVSSASEFGSEGVSSRKSQASASELASDMRSGAEGTSIVAAFTLSLIKDGLQQCGEGRDGSLVQVVLSDASRLECCSILAVHFSFRGRAVTFSDTCA